MFKFLKHSIFFKKNIFRQIFKNYFTNNSIGTFFLVCVYKSRVFCKYDSKLEVKRKTNPCFFLKL